MEHYTISVCLVSEQINNIWMSIPIYTAWAATSHGSTMWSHSYCC